MKDVLVAVGVVYQMGRGVFICKRLAHQHQGGKWEFPGGKVENNESIQDGLIRELKEELGIVSLKSSHLIDIQHQYIDKSVKLSVWLVSEFDGEPRSLEGLEHKWCLIKELNPNDFPDANVKIVELLKSKYL